jgi:DNA repair protein RadA/Sms
VTGEESAAQVAMRARRLGLEPDRLECLTETQLEIILATAASNRPQFLVVDSIQTLWSDALQSAPGAVAQVRECASRLVQFAKQTGCSVVLVGHVTKEGALAGPRVLEHMVDGVLYFESDSGSRFRLIRSVKNRFGAANELGVFAMTDGGLRAVANPSAIFLSEDTDPSAGSCVLVTREGTRPMLVEVQALVAPSSLSQPRRVAVGVDAGRLAMLLAVMHRHCGIQVGDQDVFVNVTGGIRVGETASDLAVALALQSSLRERPCRAGWRPSVRSGCPANSGPSTTARSACAKRRNKGSVRRWCLPATSRASRRSWTCAAASAWPTPWPRPARRSRARGLHNKHHETLYRRWTQMNADKTLDSRTARSCIAAERGSR